MGGSVSSPLTLCTNNIIIPTTTATAMCTPTSTHRVPHVITVAGSESGAGAGIQADHKTCAALGVCCSTVLTAVTAQNTVGVQGIHSMPETFMAAQLRSMLSDMQVDVKLVCVYSNFGASKVLINSEKFRELQRIFEPTIMFECPTSSSFP
ncbi:hypothetical protein Sjap_018180 [Stephania japonica]|uniref:Pyridoxamine kinase/Phosphomethylpyrimidine kinase domain-containing protein n=1 Tax=Stephania japonica TaxID=461633 RepID=A0AAP0I7J7_9MAGN